MLLDLSLTSPTTTYCNYDFLCHLLHILPNFYEVYLLYSNFTFHVLEEFSEECSRLEKYAWKNIVCGTNISVNDEDIQLTNNLRLFIVDDSFFNCANEEVQSDWNNYPDKFLFHKCCKVLERVSIFKAKYGCGRYIIPLDALFKFVWNDPPTMK